MDGPQASRHAEERDKTLGAPLEQMGKFAMFRKTFLESNMGEHDGWRWQGRQYHMWFGHGTKPPEEGGGDVPKTFDARVQAIAATAFATLPPAKRRHPAATFSREATAKLVTSMRAWAAAGSLSSPEFADRFMRPEVGDAGSKSLREAATLLANAKTAKDMQAASVALAEGMQAVGLDRWNRTLTALAERAQTVAPAAKTTVRLRPTITISDAPYQVAAIDFDPRDEPMSDAAKAVDARIRPIALRIIAQAQNEFDNVTVQSASNTLHNRFAKAVNDAGIPGVSAETSYKRNGRPAYHGELGSVRTDVSFVNPLTDRIEGIWDWKIGGATLTVDRAKTLVQQVRGVIGKPELPDYRVPVVEIHIELKPGP